MWFKYFAEISAPVPADAPTAPAAPTASTAPQAGSISDPPTSISVHGFSERILETLVHFHVMTLRGGFFLWVGSAPVLSNLAVSMSSRYDSMPLSTLVMGDPSNTAAIR
ncbi:proteasome assembly chaperone 4-like [Cololabis saira]|uniref:proteasome assembly chaperone 4-like n=1 Tax=Cololabis saira TaxID=129043 RepID=UPI002AD469BB|nr:proteasome assembly chaperone 4-like [Cololabis saira]